MSVDRYQSQQPEKDVPLPARVQVAGVLQSRYGSSGDTTTIAESKWYVPELVRPLSWDDRIDGIDLVCTTGGEVIKLLSSGMQSVPRPGWVLMLVGGDIDEGYRWTLYGIPPQAQAVP